jgi:adenine phosphoribosyltransferase
VPDAFYRCTANIAILSREDGMETPAVDDLKSLIRTIPDYPKPGIMFRDVTTLLGHAQGFKAAVAQMAEPYRTHRIDAVAGIEARGFILGGAVADRLGCGFVPIRKKGKLPFTTVAESYELEYGSATVELHADACKPGDRVLLIDDLIATGGTMMAGRRLLERLGAVVVEGAVIVDLPELGGSRRLRESGLALHCLVDFEGH